MDKKIEFSVASEIMDQFKSNDTESAKENRYLSCHALWQLARMAAYNTAGDLPQAIRLEDVGEVAERYEDGEQLVALIDAHESESEEYSALLQKILKFAIRVSFSKNPDNIRCQIISCAKSMQSVPENLRDWTNFSDISERLTASLQEYKEQGKAFTNIEDIDAFVQDVISKTSVTYLRRRQGRFGDESLWGRELETIKVLQDAGIKGNDIEPSMQLLRHAISSRLKSRKTKNVIDRKTAYLLIRDFQRRAYLSMESVRVIDNRFLTQHKELPGWLPRQPSWYQVAKDNALHLIKRETYDSSLKWARRAALISGRGLLPVFVLTGPMGVGKSVLIKQIAWDLYQQGYAVAEILNLEQAAVDADQLAYAAVAGDSPLILIWDDPCGLAPDLIPAIKEIAQAQISGAPIVLLTTAPSVSIFPKFFSRTIVEEFVVHEFNEGEIHDMSDPPENSDSVQTVSSDNVQGSADQNLPLNVWLRAVKKTDLQTVADSIWTTVKTASDDAVKVFGFIALLDSLPITTPKSILETVTNADITDGMLKLTLTDGNPLLRRLSDIVPDGWELLDCGHPLLAQMLWNKNEQSTDLIIELIQNAVSACIEDQHLQPWLVRLVHAVKSSLNAHEDLATHISSGIVTGLRANPSKFSTQTLSLLFTLYKDTQYDELIQVLVDNMAERVRVAGTDSFIALSPLLRNRLGGLDDSESLKSLSAARPSLDRLGFKFLLKFLGDHMPGELGNQAVEDARTAAARDPDDGYAVEAYLRLVWQRGSQEQIQRAIDETKSWLEATPTDRIVRSAFLDFILKNENMELKRQFIESLENWLSVHFDEGHLWRGYLDLGASFNDTHILDQVLLRTTEWIEKRGNNRFVRNQYFRYSEQRNDQHIMTKACHAAHAWLANHPDDRDTLRSLIFLAGRVQSQEITDNVLSVAYRWFKQHPIDKDLFKHYLSLAERNAKGRELENAVNLASDYLTENAGDHDVRETLLGMASKRIPRKNQVKIYNMNTLWLENQTDQPASIEYLVGRLGVRAGVARRAIPLLERAVSKENSALKEHARLWLGSAYRAAEEFFAARKCWETVLDSDDTRMQEKAKRNLESLDTYLKTKFPEGYPPREETPPKSRSRRPLEIKETKDQISDSRRVIRKRETPRREQREFSREPLARQTQKRLGQKERIRTGGAERGQVKPESAPRQGTTLGDLLRLQGLDLKSELQKTEKKKPKNK
ncbi:hypothetical protein JW979_15685 [bacterium]|nr:hypothetical protein [candidate division CSSED10-310 bacterium]